ncbi:MAG TPA: hypothetical protein VF824_15725 [Thermoanaerobaculia bacterium]
MFGRRVVISIHGLESEGTWQRQIDPSFQGIHDLHYRRHEYGRFRAWKAIVPFIVGGEVKRFADFYARVFRETGVVPSVIAHSLGTWILSQALVQYPTIRFRNVILCGSVIDRDYDWPNLIDQGRVYRVRNEMSVDDEVVRLFRSPFFRFLLADSGPSGLDGFTREHHKVSNVRFNFGHTGFFLMLTHCDRYWRPYICENEDVAALCDRCMYGPNEAEAMETLRRFYRPELVRKLHEFFPKAPEAKVEGLADASLPLYIQRGATGKYDAVQLAWFLAYELAALDAKTGVS